MQQRNQPPPAGPPAPMAPIFPIECLSIRVVSDFSSPVVSILLSSEYTWMQLNVSCVFIICALVDVFLG